MYLLSSSGLYILSGSALYNLSRVLFLCIFIILVLNFGVLKFWRCCAICSFVKLLEGSVLKLVELEMGVVVCCCVLKHAPILHCVENIRVSKGVWLYFFLIL